MAESQNSKLAGMLVEHQRYFSELSTDDAQWAIQHPKEAVALCVEAIKGRTNGINKKLLELVTTTSVAAIDNFKATDHFKVDTKKAAVRIYYLGDYFKKHFGRKTEGASEAVDIKVHKLLEGSLDAQIITELAEKCEITLGQFFALLSKQGKGEPGPLLTNGWANISYIKDATGILWAVGASWNAGCGGWGVEVFSVGCPLRWHVGYRVLSR